MKTRVIFLSARKSDRDADQLLVLCRKNMSRSETSFVRAASVARNEHSRPQRSAKWAIAPTWNFCFKTIVKFNTTHINYNIIL
jgi:hypothetical protein